MSLATDIIAAFKQDTRGLPLFTQGGARYEDLARRGQQYGTMATGAVAALVVRPTVTAAFEIWNQHPQGKVMVIDRIFSHELVTSTTGLGGGAGIWAMVGPQIAPTDAALAINSINGGGIPGTATVRTAASQTVEDHGWFPYGNALKKESAGAVVPGGVIEALIEGRLRVKPGDALCIHVVSGYVADTFCSGATWFWEDA